LTGFVVIVTTAARPRRSILQLIPAPLVGQSAANRPNTQDGVVVQEQLPHPTVQAQHVERGQEVDGRPEGAPGPPRSSTHTESPAWASQQAAMPPPKPEPFPWWTPVCDATVASPVDRGADRVAIPTRLGRCRFEPLLDVGI
jgi:hypothetical protein